MAPTPSAIPPLRGLIAAACGILLASPAVLAQSAVGPGDISRQVEPIRTPELPALQLKPQRITRPSQPAAGEPVVRLQQWVLQGNQVLATEALQVLLQPFTGVDVSLPQIREAAAVLQQAYEDAGWLARVDAPAQDITEGRVTLQITESRLGQVRLDANATTRVAAQRVQRFVQTQQSVGQPLHLPSLDRGLLLADDLNGVGLVGTLQAGAQPGTTDVVLSTAAEPPYSLDMSLDNGNARTVGANKLTLTGSWVSPAGYGETYGAQVFKSEGSDYLRLSAHAPLGYSGLRGSLNLSQLNYRIITPDANGQVPDIGGRSQVAGLDLNYPLLRSRQANVYATAGLEQRRYRGLANAQVNSQYRIDGQQLGLVGNFFDSLWGGAANSYSLIWRHGQVKSGQVPVNADVAGHFRKLSWSYSRQQAVSSEHSLFVAINGQSTGSKPLDGSENLSLGGPNGVRAYPVGEASGPQGHVISLEWRWRLSPQWLVSPFYDQGRIEKRPSNTACANLPAYSLAGAGIRVSWTGPQGWAAQATYARRLGTNPCDANGDGKDQDGSFHPDRLWVTVSRSF